MWIQIDNKHTKKLGSDGYTVDFNENQTAQVDEETGLYFIEKYTEISEHNKD